MQNVQRKNLMYDICDIHKKAQIIRNSQTDKFDYGLWGISLNGNLLAVVDCEVVSAALNLDLVGIFKLLYVFFII